jgi:hypothetical protein
MLGGALLSALSAPAWAGSSQAPLAVAVVVPARCAVQMPGTVVTADLPAAAARETVAMRCTKGALPSGRGSIMAPGAVGPQITRTFLPAGSPLVAPRPLSDATPIPGAETSGPRVVITVNF